MKMSVTLLATS